MYKRYEKRLRASIEYHYSIRGDDPMWVHDVFGNSIGLVHIWMGENKIVDNDAPLIILMFKEIVGMDILFDEGTHRFNLPDEVKK